MPTEPNIQTVTCYNGVERPRCDCVLLADGSTWVEQGNEEIVHLASGEWWWIDDCVETDDGEWHYADNTFTCQQCSRCYHENDSYTGPGDDVLCTECYSDHTSDCGICGERCYDDDLHENDEGDYVCNDCECARPQLIQCYSDKTANRLRPVSKDKCLFGIELEVEAACGDSYAGAEFVRKFLPDDYCVLKSDGSLGAGGFEIVSRPDSVAVHRDMFSRLLTAKPARILTSWTNGRCGMHVHVTRSALSELQIGKMLCFLNAPENERFIIKVAGRRSERWSRISKKKVSDVFLPAERYSALNLCGSRTVEFRIFKGTLTAESFFKNLEFCAALVEFTSPCSRSIKDSVSLTQFLRWIPYKTYPNLYSWLVKRNWLFDRRPRKRAG